MLRHGRRGLGFAVGKEPLPAFFASCGCNITATDLSQEDARHEHWSSANQWAKEKQDLNARRLCDPTEFEERVDYRAVDMNAIPKDLNGYDFTWSSCSFEHCGSLELGKRFVLEQMRCLRPGGVAVHTTEFNLSSNTDTFESARMSIFRLVDIEDLCQELRRAGHTVEPLDIRVGEHELDGFVDPPPYHQSRSAPNGQAKHLRLRLAGYVATSIGLIIVRGPT
jgi:SAM-dependent methyltransferase